MPARTSLGIWAFGFVPGGYRPEHAEDTEIVFAPLGQVQA